MEPKSNRELAKMLQATPEWTARITQEIEAARRMATEDGEDFDEELAAIEVEKELFEDVAEALTIAAKDLGRKRREHIRGNRSLRGVSA